jgi:exosortase B
MTTDRVEPRLEREPLRRTAALLRGRLGPAYDYLPLLGAAALALMPLYFSLAKYEWPRDDQSYGPFILAAALWLMYQKREKLRALEPRPAPVTGWPIFVSGLFALFVSQTQDLYTVQAWSQLPIFGGLILMFFGYRAARILAFPFFFLIFSFPLPEWLIDAITLPLKSLIADTVVNVLYRGGYPVAQNGVIITIANYQLMVQDACAGLNSLFSLSAVSIFYIYLARHLSMVQNGLLIASIFPVSVVANLIRVLLLVTMTYYFGDSFTSGFFHEMAGVVLFTAALVSIFLVDSILTLTGRLFMRFRIRAAA